jgi:hypothetical protein
MKSWIYNIALSLFAVFAPIKPLILSVGFLIFADCLTGVWAAKKRGEQIKSAALRRTVSKMVIYQIALLTGFLVEIYMIEGLLPISKLVAGAIGMVEFKSILENSTVITGQDLFKSLIQKLGSKNDKSE